MFVGRIDRYIFLSNRIRRKFNCFLFLFSLWLVYWLFNFVLAFALALSVTHSLSILLWFLFCTLYAQFYSIHPKNWSNFKLFISNALYVYSITVHTSRSFFRSFAGTNRQQQQQHKEREREEKKKPLLYHR